VNEAGKDRCASLGTPESFQRGQDVDGIYETVPGVDGWTCEAKGMLDEGDKPLKPWDRIVKKRYGTTGLLRNNTALQLVEQ
jgi:hypothetical protein